MSFNRAISRISGGVISFFMNQFLRLTYILFLLAGAVCAIISGLIEYEVFAELYKKGSGTALAFFSIPLLIVFSLEVTKVFLVFFHKQACRTFNEGYLSDARHFAILRGVLITTSAACTLLFSFYSLHNPEYEKRLAQKTREVNATHQQQLKQIQAEFNKRLAGIDEEVEIWRARLDAEAQRIVNGVSEGPRYKAYEKKYNESVKRRDALRTQLETERLRQIGDVTRAHEGELVRLEESLKSDRSVDNRMLSATLQVLNGTPNYPRWQYIFSIFVISLLLSVALESVIVCSFKVLAIYHGDLFELDLFRKTSEQKMQGLAEAVDDLHEAELASFKKRVLREKENTLDTLKDIADRG